MANSSSPLDVANTVIATLGFVMAAASLTWQAISWRLSGSRASAELLIGALRHSGVYITLPPRSSTEAVELFKKEGFTQKAIFVVVRNAGRLPIAVEHCRVVFPGKYKIGQLSFAVGPQLPYLLGVGEAATWGVEVARIAAMIQMLREVRGLRSVNVRFEVDLGNNKTVRTRKKARL